MSGPPLCAETQHTASFHRLSDNLGVLLAGMVAAILLFSGVAPWVAWSQAPQRISEGIPGPLIASLVIVALTLVVTRP